MKNSKPTDYVRLLHIRDYGIKIQSLLEGFNFNTFENDDRTNLAVTRCIEIIGEAVYRLDKSVKINYPQIPWVNIEGMRHKVVHDYYELDITTLYKVATVFIPQLLTDIEPIIKDLEP